MSGEARRVWRMVQSESVTNARGRGISLAGKPNKQTIWVVLQITPVGSSGVTVGGRREGRAARWFWWSNVEEDDIQSCSTT